MSNDKKTEQTSQTLWQVGDDNQKLLTWAYLGSGLLLWFVLGRFIEFAANLTFSKVMVDSTLALQWERSPIRPGFVIAALASLGFGLYVRYKNRQWNTYGLEVVAELKKVNWPARDVTAKSTIAVIITVFICAVILGSFDLIWGNLSTWFLK